MKIYSKFFLTLFILIMATRVVKAGNTCPTWKWAEPAGSLGSLGSAYGYGIISDASGNTYITGSFNGTAHFGNTILTASRDVDIYIAKINATGEYQWAIKAGGTGIDEGQSIAIDGSGNIYVTGYFNGTASFGSTNLTSSGAADIFVAKLNNSGQWQWAINAGGTNTERAQDITIDGTGNVYVTGSFSGTSSSFGSTNLTSLGGTDLFVAKLNNSGQWQWAVQAIGSNVEVGNSIIADASGNIYITGYLEGGASFGSINLSAGIFVAKLNNSGQWQWAARGSGNYNRVNSITVDGSGNAYITGYFQSSVSFGSINLSASGQRDIFVAKIDGNGQWQWAAKAGGSGFNYAYGITLDASGNILITGNLNGSASFGSTNLSPGIYVAKLNTNGQWQWAIKANGTGNGTSYDLTTDASGNTYFTGYFYSSVSFGNQGLSTTGSSDIFVVKLNSSNQLQWALNIGQSSYTNSQSITSDISGNTYITGNFSGYANFGNTNLTASGTTDIFVSKINSSGQWQWAAKAGGTGYAGGNSVAIDASGNTYITGYFRGTVNFGSTVLNSSFGPSSNDNFIAKLNNKGEWEWAVKSGGSSYGEGSGITVDASGNIFVSGYFSGTATFGSTSLSSSSNELFVAKLNSSGQFQWAVKSGGSGTKYGRSIINDASGNLYITGDFSGNATIGSTNLTTTGSSDIFVAKLNNSGQWQWAIKAGGTGYDGGKAITIDASDNIYLTGYYNFNASFGSINITGAGQNDIFVAKLNNNGVWQWVAKAGNSWIDNGNSIAVDKTGNSYITGTYQSSIKFDQIQLNTNGTTEIFIAKLNSSGQWQWAEQVGLTASTNAKGTGISVDTSANIYATGFYQGTASFDGRNLTASGNTDAFVIKIKEENLSVNAGGNFSLICGEKKKFNTTGTGYSFIKWSPQTGLDDPNIIAAVASPNKTTTYTVSVRNKCGDSTTAQVTVTVNPLQLTASADKNTINCGESTNFTANVNISAPVSYLWSPVKGLSNPNIANPVARPANTTTYTVTASSSNGCSATSQVTITVNNPNPPAVGLTTSTGEKYFCNSGLTLSAGSGFASYKWNTGETTRSITPNQPGTYTVEIIDNGGCGNKDSITLIPLTKITAPDGPYLCADQPNPSVRLDAGAGFDSYEWNNGQQTQFLTVNTPGTYSAKVTKGSCVYTTSIQVMNHPGTTNAEFTYQSNGLKTQFTTLTPGVRFMDWNFGDGNNSSTINPEHIYSQPGTYNVCLELTDYCGATDKQCKSITVSAANSIEDVKKEEDKIKIYPNPATNHLVIEMENSIHSPIIITDITGRQVLNTINPLSNQITIDISSLSGGLYFVNINQENYKFIKQ